LTHRSFAYESGGIPTNERLEFLGDSVIGLVITEELYRRFPEMDESGLSPLRSGVVSTRALAQVARTLGIGKEVRIGKGEEVTGGREKNSILADSLEASDWCDLPGTWASKGGASDHLFDAGCH